MFGKILSTLAVILDIYPIIRAPRAPSCLRPHLSPWYRRESWRASPMGRSLS